MEAESEKAQGDHRDYAQYRTRHMRELDRDYAAYQGEHQDGFHRDFHAWREKRNGPPQAVQEPLRTDSKDESGQQGR